MLFSSNDPAAIDFGREPVAGDALALPDFAARTEERGVILPFVSVSLTGVFTTFALGAGGSDRALDAVGDAVALVAVTALLATRGMMGVRAVRVDASAGFKGRVAFFEPSGDIRPDSAIIVYASQ